MEVIYQKKRKSCTCHAQEKALLYSARLCLDSSTECVESQYGHPWYTVLIFHADQTC